MVALQQNAFAPQMSGCLNDPLIIQPRTAAVSRQVRGRIPSLAPRGARGLLSVIARKLRYVEFFVLHRRRFSIIKFFVLKLYGRVQLVFVV
jgi:hypothetical protein